MARVGREEQGERQRDLQQPASPHGAAGRHSLRRRSRCAFQHPEANGVPLVLLSRRRDVLA